MPISLRGAALEPGDASDRSVRRERRKARLDVRRVEIAADVQPVCRRLHGPRLDAVQEAFHVALDFGAERAGRRLELGRRDLEGHDDVRLHLDDALRDPRRQGVAPGTLMGQVAAIADEGGGIVGQPGNGLDDIAELEDERNAPLAQRAGGIGQTFQHEGVGTLVRLRVVRDEDEGDEEGQVARVGDVERVFERRVLHGPLRRLHPVEDVDAVRVRLGVVERPNACVLDHVPALRSIGRTSGPSRRDRGHRRPAPFPRPA